MGHAIDLSGKVALVTGSSRGIGAGIVQALHECGARCMVNYVADPSGRNQADAEKVAGELSGVPLIQCDVGNDDQVAQMMQRVQ